MPPGEVPSFFSGSVGYNLASMRIDKPISVLGSRPPPSPRTVEGPSFPDMKLKPREHDVPSS
ncbi:hypothetical protein GQ44DRAFT_711336 [Phaeosphaeriaceae sp. PMI808]|nr:hypothetical protein GQ44DRAFT_711336 [Phaeosphaeriaceae sp. PMI808]